MDKKKCTAIILAAGQGKRMGTKVQKQFLNLGGKPVLWYALYAFENSPVINDIILVTGADLVEYCQREIVEKYGFCKVRSVTAGGAERYHSVWKGLCAMEDKENRIVFIHDGARPFVDEAMIGRAYEEASASGACVIGMPVKDTIKIADKDGFIQSTPDRSQVWSIQTPQIFAYPLIRSAHESLRAKDMSGVTDDAMVVEQEKGTKIRLVEGSYQNIKITTPEDLDVAETFLKKYKKM